MRRGYDAVKDRTWLFENVDSLPFVGKSSFLEWTRVGYGLELEEDVILLLTSAGDYVKYVVNTDGDNGEGKVIFGEVN